MRMKQDEGTKACPGVSLSEGPWVCALGLVLPSFPSQSLPDSKAGRLGMLSKGSFHLLILCFKEKVQSGKCARHQ